MHLTISQRDTAQIWRIERPDRLNALGPTLGQELLDALKHLQDQLARWAADPDQGDPPYRTLVIDAAPINSGSDTPIWIAGGDLKELRELKAPEEGRSYAWMLAELCNGLQDLPIPVLAVIDGLAIGGGVELALAADLRLASRRSSFHFKQLEVGLATGYGSCQRLIALVGQARATDLLLRCRRLSATEAQALGLINDLCEQAEDLGPALSEILEGLARLSSQGLKVQKKMLHAPFHDERGHLVQQELDDFATLWMHPSHKRFLDHFAKPSAVP
ncbi:MAG: enoyl-CoA hydratase/isomerase family protein [Oligoflexus sp.]|jgi:enoyl-CoA hydratase/carnithine racemase